MTLITSEKKFVPSLPRFWRWLGKLVTRISGWGREGEIPGFDKWIAAEYPHTSNWDGFLFLQFAASEGMRSNWVIKDQWTKGWIGKLFLAAGAIGVDRTSSQDTVQQMVHAINQREKVVLVITPEGTRKHTSHIKAGFYWIAYHSKTPIVLVTADYRTKKIIFGPSYMATGDIEADMAKFFEWFKDKPAGAKYPEQAGNLFIRRSAKAGLNSSMGEGSGEAKE
jgi:1-acyl-sn-glycerol-3-phosphate acyltransferase